MRKLNLKELEELNVITKGHFVFSSGMHSEIYFNKCKIYEDPELVSEIAREMAAPFKGAGTDLVVGPATGGIVLSTLVAKELGTKGIWADKEGQEFEFKRGWDKLIPEQKILFVEDVVTTGNSINKVINLTKSLGGKLFGLTAIANRNPNNITQESFDVEKFTSLYQIDFPIYSSKNCPLCEKGVPISTDLGHGIIHSNKV